MRYNYKYGKLDGQNITYAPMSGEINGTWYFPLSESQLRELEYKEVIDIPYTTDEKQYVSSWTQDDLTITRVWIQQADLTPTQQREEAYRNMKLIEYPEHSDSYLTVDEARNMCGNYCYEDTERAKEIITYLTSEITKAKTQIRGKYPDKE